MGLVSEGIGADSTQVFGFVVPLSPAASPAVSPGWPPQTTCPRRSRGHAAHRSAHGVSILLPTVSTTHRFLTRVASDPTPPMLQTSIGGRTNLPRRHFWSRLYGQLQCGARSSLRSRRGRCAAHAGSGVKQAIWHILSQFVDRVPAGCFASAAPNMLSPCRWRACWILPRTMLLSPQAGPGAVSRVRSDCVQPLFRLRGGGTCRGVNPHARAGRLPRRPIASAGG